MLCLYPGPRHDLADVFLPNWHTLGKFVNKTKKNNSLLRVLLLWHISCFSFGSKIGLFEISNILQKNFLSTPNLERYDVDPSKFFLSFS